MPSYYVIYCEKFRKVLQRTEKVALSQTMYGITYLNEGNNANIAVITHWQNSH